MTHDVRILLIGQILVDVFIPEDSENYRIRFGGIMHAARALWAIGCHYDIAYITPDYLDDQINKYAERLAADDIQKLGSVTGSPNIILCRAPKEFGPQGYEYLLRDEHRVSITPEVFSRYLDSDKWTDIILFPGGFDLRNTLVTVGNSSAKVQIDVNFEPENWNELNKLGRPLDTLILSTSSDYFLKTAKGDVTELVRGAHQIGAKYLLLKENRGGSRLFCIDDPKKTYRVPAQVRDNTHSVGVGDCFNAVYSALKNKHTDIQALSYASCIAAEYACTMNLDKFRNTTRAWLNISPTEVENLHGVSLCWEDRPNCQIYLAAPDFDFVNTLPLNKLVESLEYHNFSPRRPVKEHGQIGKNASEQERINTYNLDISLLNECSILIAVLLYNDPGTLIEIGLAFEKAIPVLVYDPYNTAENLMLTVPSKIVTDDINKLINALFEEIQRINGDDG